MQEKSDLYPHKLFEQFASDHLLPLNFNVFAK